jgi:hypothetical protein
VKRVQDVSYKAQGLDQAAGRALGATLGWKYINDMAKPGNNATLRMSF